MNPSTSENLHKFQEVEGNEAVCDHSAQTIFKDGELSLKIKLRFVSSFVNFDAFKRQKKTRTQTFEIFKHQ